MYSSYLSSPVTNESDEVALLMQDIGVKVNMNYTNNGSYPASWWVLPSVTTNNIENAFKNNYGYSSSISTTAYNYSQAMQQLDLGRPLIMLGFDEGQLAFWTGHYWVIDGYEYVISSYDYYLVYIVEMSAAYNSFEVMQMNTSLHVSNYYWSYLYMNWGWGGAYNNTKFHAGTFNPGVHDYDYYLRMIYNIF